jgi:hypothetical protein
MAVDSVITNGTEKKYKAKVTSAGQLVVTPISYDDVVFNELATANTAYNFFGPKSAKNFILTGIVAKADKQVSSTVDASVVVYEADSASSTTVDRTLFQIAMVEGDLAVVVPLNIKANEGVYINAKTTDDDIHVTLTGYYIDKII